MILIMPCLLSNSVWIELTLLKPFSSFRIIEEMLGKIKQKLDKEEKEEQLQDLLTDKFEGNMAQKNPVPSG